MRRSLIVSLAAAACALGSSAVHATNLQVTVSETGISGISQVVASWTQNQNPTPVTYSAGNYTTVPVWNATGLGGDTAISWYSTIQLGGFTNYHEDFNVLAPVSYASAEMSPTFVPGTYYGVDLKPDYSYITASYTIAILPDAVSKAALADFSLGAPASPVPESTTWAMMLIGVGITGFALRSRQKSLLNYAS